jgi:threonine/homoserine/homoserine lactone efflux protein
MLFSVRKSRNAYIAAKTWIDRAMGGFLGLIGARLIVDA